MQDSPTAWPFADAAPYYDAYRSPYATQALDFVARTLAVGPGMRVLDLGCGPGTLTIPLSRLGASVVAVDPDPAMLAQGRNLARQRNAGDVEWLCGRAEDLLPQIGTFQLVVLGQSLHWMDRDLVLKRLALTVENGGALVIFDESPDFPGESWSALAARIAGKYVGRFERHPLKHPESRHEPSLLRSRHFAEFEEHRFGADFVRSSASILGCVYSSVHTPKPAFCDNVAHFEAELLVALRSVNPSDVFHERIETSVLIARKRPVAPGPAGHIASTSVD